MPGWLANTLMVAGTINKCVARLAWSASTTAGTEKSFTITIVEPVYVKL